MRLKDIDDLDTWMRLRRKMKVYYFSYGYTRNPAKMTRVVKAKVQHILLRRSDIVPIIPHCCFDYLYDLPKGYSHPEMAHWEVEIISRCDAIVYEPSIDSLGVRWEVAIAQKLDVKAWTYQEVAEGKDID